MFIRVRFAKYGALKYIGHLDVMRYFQKAVRRSRLDVVYSKGFHPHQIMSFALPLGVGVTSDGEYMDLELATLPCVDGSCADTAQHIQNQLNSVMTEGIEVLYVRLLGEREPQKHQDSAMSLVSMADYYVSFRNSNNSGITSREMLEESFSRFLAQESITVTKKSKKTERELDIRPYIYEAGYSTTNNDGILHADENETGLSLYLRLAAGSVMNIKPELVVESFYNFLGREYKRFDIRIHRMNMYGGTPEAVEYLVQG